jgi:hypothetical protein
VNFGTPSYLRHGSTFAGDDEKSQFVQVCELVLAEAGVSDGWFWMCPLAEKVPDAIEYIQDYTGKLSDKKKEKLRAAKKKKTAAEKPPSKEEVEEAEVVLVQGAKQFRAANPRSGNLLTSDDPDKHASADAAVALVLGAAVGRVGLWAFKKYGKRS